MTLEEFKKIKLPDNPGVYLFKDNTGKVLYIGKATSLRDRVRSYFSDDLIETRGRLLVDMVALAAKIDFLETDSVLEALLLEANLIKTHLPKYNTKEKDNKSYNYVAITKEDFPAIKIVRGRLLDEENKYTFGPFPHGAELKEAMKIIRRIFPYRDEKCKPNQGRPCFNRQIGLCPGVCTGEVSKEEYSETIQDIRLLFEAKKKELLKKLEDEMQNFAQKQEFEKAAIIRQKVFALTHIRDVAILKRQKKITSVSSGGTTPTNSFRIEAYDVAHSAGTNVVGVMTVIEDGEVAKSEYRKFKIKLNPGVNDTGALREILRRRLGHVEWPLPKLIVVDGGKAQINAASAVLKVFGFEIPVVSVLKDEYHKPKDILGDKKIKQDWEEEIILANSEAHRFAIKYHRSKRDMI